MAYPQYRGNKDKVHNTGIIDYVGDGTSFYPILASTAGVSTSAKPIIGQREPFIFRPGRSALASTSAVTGMVLSGVRSGGVTVTSTAAATTMWGTEVVYEPSRAGKIDGVAASGEVSGQITIGSISKLGAIKVKHTARIRNKSGTWTTCLAVSASITVGATTEVYSTYDIPHLLTTADFNAVPFGIAIGCQSDKLAASAAICRIMESSFVTGEFEPGT